MFDRMLLCFALLPLASLIVGLLLGSWLTHRAGRGQSPIPALPLPPIRRRTPPQADDPPPAPRRSKP